MLRDRPTRPIRTPGDESLPDGPERDEMAYGSDIEAAIEAGRRGEARRIERPRAVLPEVNIKGLRDPERPATANVNKQPTLSCEEAMQMAEDGRLAVPVLTPQGWVLPRAPGVGPKGGEHA
jgi:hypothetical protein